MCMDKFVKRLYDFMGIYRIFWSQNSHYRYLPIFYQYFIDIYRYFTDIFLEISAQARVFHSRDFLVEKAAFSDFLVKNRRFYRFFLYFFFSVLAENRFFGDISVKKTNFFVPGQTVI